MTNENERDVKEKMRTIFQDYSFEIIKGMFIALDFLLSQCKSFEDFKVSVKQTVDNLTKKEEENET